MLLIVTHHYDALWHSSARNLVFNLSSGWLSVPSGNIVRQGQEKDEISIFDDILPSLLTRNGALMQILVQGVLVSKINSYLLWQVNLNFAFSVCLIYVILVRDGDNIQSYINNKFYHIKNCRIILRKLHFLIGNSKCAMEFQYKEFWN